MKNFFSMLSTQEYSRMRYGKPEQLYIVDAKKVKGSNGLIAGTCYILNQPFFVLFNYGESHFFIFTKFGLEVISLPSPTVVNTSKYSNIETS